MRVSIIALVLGLMMAIGARIYGDISGSMPIAGHVVMYFGLVGILYWLYDNVEALVLSFRTRGTRQSGLGALIVILGLGIFVAVNYIAFKNPKRHDATDVGLFTLAPQTIKLVSELDAPLRIIAFFPDMMEGKDAFKSLIEGYQGLNENLELLWVDPGYEPTMVTKYGVRRPGTVVLEMGEGRTQLTELTEANLTNAIIGLTRSERKLIAILEGHKEKSPEEMGLNGLGAAVTELKKKGFEVKTHHLISEGALPENARILIVPGPTVAPLDSELALLTDFLKAGGHMLLMIDPETPAPWMTLAEDYGFALPEAIIIDQVGQTMVGDATMPIIVGQGFHEITLALGGAPVIMRYARPIVAGVPAEGVKFEPLAATSSEAWGETNLEAFELESPNLQEGDITVAMSFNPESDIEGPISVMALATWAVGATEAQTDPDTPSKTGMMIVVGDSDFASDILFEQSVNGDLFLNAVSFLAQEEDLISIRPRVRENIPFSPTEVQGTFTAYLALLIVPGFPLLLALAMYFRRRNL